MTITAIGLDGANVRFGSKADMCSAKGYVRFTRGDATATAKGGDAGRPGVLPRLASFAAWSDTVRSALVWLGKADPLDTLESTRADDPERSLLSEVLQAWAKDHGIGAGSDVPLSVIVDRAMKMQSTGAFDSTLEPVFPDLHTAVRAATGAVGYAKVDVRKFGIWCRGSKGRIVDGVRLRNKSSKRGGAATWWVERQ